MKTKKINPHHGAKSIPTRGQNVDTAAAMATMTLYEQINTLTMQKPCVQNDRMHIQRCCKYHLKTSQKSKTKQ